MDIPSYVEVLFRLATRKPKPKQPEPTPSKPDKIVGFAIAYSERRTSRFGKANLPPSLLSLLRIARARKGSLANGGSRSDYRSEVSTVMLPPVTRDTHVQSLVFAAFSSSLKNTSR